MGFSTTNHPFWDTPIYGNAHLSLIQNHQNFQPTTPPFRHDQRALYRRCSQSFDSVLRALMRCLAAVDLGLHPWNCFFFFGGGGDIERSMESKIHVKINNPRFGLEDGSGKLRNGTFGHAHAAEIYTYTLHMHIYTYIYIYLHTYIHTYILIVIYI